MTESTRLTCPACSACLDVAAMPSNGLFLCSACGAQFRAQGDWPIARTSQKAVASFCLGICSICGLFAVPALFLGLWAIRDIKHPRSAEILSGKWLAIVGASLGGISCLGMVVLPLSLLIPLQQELKSVEFDRDAQAFVEDEAWPEAVAKCNQIMELQPDNQWHWLRASPVYAFFDEQEYRQFAERMLIQFGETQDPVVAGRTAKACLLLPPTEAQLELASQLAEYAASQETNRETGLWIQVTCGLARYRRGDYDGAITSCKNCQEGDPKDRTWKRAALAYFVTALAKFRLDENEEARHALARGRAILQSHPDLDSSWHDHLIARLLEKEAGSTITSDATKR